jgi:anti-sigma B factor antagonist
MEREVVAMSLTDVPFSLSVRREESAVVVVVGGELDLDTSPRLRHVLMDLVRAQGNRSIVLDVAWLTFIDSSALGVLVTVHRDLAAVDGRLTVRSASNAVRRVFEITGLDRAIVVLD